MKRSGCRRRTGGDAGVAVTVEVPPDVVTSPVSVAEPAKVACTPLLLGKPGGSIILLVDDTLAHKRGKSVCGLGWFRDAVALTQKRVATASGHNWVVLAVAVCVPFTHLPILALPLWPVHPGEAYIETQEPSGGGTRGPSSRPQAPTPFPLRCSRGSGCGAGFFARTATAAQAFSFAMAPRPFSWVGVQSAAMYALSG